MTDHPHRPVEPCPDCGALNNLWNSSYSCRECGAQWTPRTPIHF